MSKLLRALMVIPLLLFITGRPARAQAPDAAAPDPAQPKKVLRVVQWNTHDGWVLVTAPDSLTRYQLTVRGTLRGRSISSVREAPLIEFTLSDTSKDAVATDMALYNGRDQFQTDAHIFRGFQVGGANTKQGFAIKLTRLGQPVDVILPEGTDDRWMILRAAMFKEGDLVIARYKGAQNVAYDLDIARPVIRGVFVKNGDAIIDGRKCLGIVLDVAGEEQVLALPPAGQKLRTGDGEVLTMARKLGKGDPVRVTCDSERPGVIRTMEPDVDILPSGHDDILILVPGLSVDMSLDSRHGSIHASLNPRPASERDANLRAGIRDRMYDETLEIPNRDQIRTLMRDFAFEPQVQADGRKISDYLLQKTLGRAFDPAKLAPMAASLAVEASKRYRPQAVNAYDDMRRLLGEELAKTLEQHGAELRGVAEPSPKPEDAPPPNEAPNDLKLPGGFVP